MFCPTETFCRSLAFIQTRNRIIYPSELSDSFLDAWIDPHPEAAERLSDIQAAREVPTSIYKETPDYQMIPLKVFVYTYDRFCMENYRDRGPGHWLDPQAEKRYSEFQFLIHTLRKVRDHGMKNDFPVINIFDYDSYPAIIQTMSRFH